MHNLNGHSSTYKAQKGDFFLTLGANRLPRVLELTNNFSIQHTQYPDYQEFVFFFTK